MSRFKLPLVLHIPHASTLIPSNYREHFCLSDEQLRLEKVKMTDWYTDDLFEVTPHKKVKTICFPVSRLLVDPERFPDDKEEVMSQVGMGAVYTKTSDGSSLRDQNFASEEWREQLLNEYYYTHHSTFTGAVESTLETDSGVLIIDCHSFPNKPLPYELDQSVERPEICIGTDEYHTSGELTDCMVTSFRNLGYKVEVNAPFAGSIVPSKFYQTDRRVSSIMIEVNRSLYMDEITADKISSYNEHKTNISDVLSAVKQYV